jgi:hypothetical protein
MFCVRCCLYFGCTGISLLVVNMWILCSVVVVGVSDARKLMVVSAAMRVLFKFVLDGVMVGVCLYVAGVVIVVL